jgi:hypothetical protein
MHNYNHITGCSGSAVKLRHCPATVMDELSTAGNHCAQREGGRRVQSQETGLVSTQPDFRGGVYAQNSYGCLLARAVDSGLAG